MGSRLPKFREFYRAGKEIAKRRGGVVDLGIIRQVLTLSMLNQHISNDQARLPTVVIGDGWGTMASLILSCTPQSKVVLVNLTSMLLVDLVYIRKSFPLVGICLARNAEEYQTALNCDKVGVVAVCADDSEIIRHGAIGVAINIASMQEMDPPVIASYFDAFRSRPNTKTLFYCCNRIEKQLPDGIEIRFEEYPWERADNVLVDEDCPWHQYYLGFGPPIQRKYDGPVWHRLAELNKDISVS
jgi:putative sugar O-methyltransferase